MRLLLIPILITLVSCGKIVPDFRHKKGPAPERKTTDPTFNKYIEEFESYRGTTVTVPIVFDSNMSNATGGICTTWSSGYREITINPKLWNSTMSAYDGLTAEEMLELRRQQLIDHELGHCQLGRKHNDSIIDWLKQSIMHSYMFGYSDLINYYNNINDFIAELYLE